MRITAHKKKHEINLLPKSGFASTTSGRILTWLLSTFRVIVIVTEILVMVVFLSRFWLDAQNSDLNDQLEQKRNLLTASQDFEENLADVQKRIEVYSQYTQKTNQYTSTLRSFTVMLPPDVLLTDLTLDNSSLKINGSSPSERSIQQLISNMQADEQFTNIKIENLESAEEQEGFIRFNITAERTAQ